jgi:hypothetical protein
MHRKVSFSELPDSNTFRGILAILGICILTGMILSLFQIAGVVDLSWNELSYSEWQTQHSQTYQEYVAEQDQLDLTGNALFLVIFPLAWLLFFFFVYFYTPTTWQKCPRGHVVGKGNKADTVNYCRVCGVKLYSQQELSPEEWKKRYEGA